MVEIDTYYSLFKDGRYTARKFTMIVISRDEIVRETTASSKLSTVKRQITQPAGSSCRNTV